jgi:methyl-accepting chemotaxis protein
LEDFIRSYIPTTVRYISISRDKIDAAYAAMNKYDEASRNFNCAACGCETCLEMAEKIAKGLNVSENCVQKMHKEVVQKHEEAKSILSNSINSYETILTETNHIKEMTESIVSNMTDVTDAVSQYDRMVTDIERISEKVNIISLNASVEAAKAGLHGLAFGVVAKEIRSLAQSSADSAMQTKEAAEKAGGAISTVNDIVLKIKEKVQSSCDVIETISEDAKKIANK